MPLIDYPTEVFDQLMTINVRGVFLGLKHVLPHMIEQKKRGSREYSFWSGFTGNAKHDGVWRK